MSFICRKHFFLLTSLFDFKISKANIFLQQVLHIADFVGYIFCFNNQKLIKALFAYLFNFLAPLKCVNSFNLQKHTLVQQRKITVKFFVVIKFYF